MNDTVENEFRTALSALLEQMRQEGLAEGLAVADHIRGLLTREPDTERQAETRKWADAAINRAKETRGET